MDDFATAAPLTRGEFSVELFAQLRNTGRILDNFRLGLDGATPLEVSVDLAAVIPAAAFAGWRLTQQFWARDVAIRKNMVTSAWVTITDAVASQDCDLTDADGAGVSASEFVRTIAQLPGNGPTNGSTRWAIVIGGDGLLKLQWQALPLPASTLNGKTTFKRWVHLKFASRNYTSDGVASRTARRSRC
jgi:hypothetical protein